MTVFSIVYKNLKKRLFGTALTLLSLSAGITLFSTVEAVRITSEEAFRSTSSAYDLILAAKGSALQAVLNSIFHLETSTGVVPFAVYEAAIADPRVEKAFPVYVGDQYRGFRLIGTTAAFLESGARRSGQPFKIASGTGFTGVMDCVAGAEAARILGLKPGDKIIPEHGVLETGGETALHEEAELVVSGILAPTFTSSDRVIYADMRALAYAHSSQSANHGDPDDHHDHANHHEAEHAVVAELDAVLLVMKNPAAALQAAGNINYPLPANPVFAMNMRRDPFFPFRATVMAVIPAMEISKLMGIVGRADQVLRIVSLFVILVSLFGLIVAMYNTMNERTEELAIMRALGARKIQIFGLIVLESVALTVIAGLLSVLLLQVALAGLAYPLAKEAGIFIELPYLSADTAIHLLVFIFAGTLAGSIPAFRAYQVDPVTILSNS